MRQLFKKMPKYSANSELLKFGMVLQSTCVVSSKCCVNFLRFTKKVLLAFDRLKLWSLRYSSKMFLHSLLKALNKFLFITSALRLSFLEAAGFCTFLGELAEKFDRLSSDTLVVVFGVVEYPILSDLHPLLSERAEPAFTLVSSILASCSNKFSGTSIRLI